MSVDDIDEPRLADSEETIDEGNGDTEGAELSEVSGLNGKEDEEELESSPPPKEAKVSPERPIGVEEGRVLQSQEKTAVESKTEKKDKPKSEDTFRKLSEQLAKHFQVSTIASHKTRDTLQQIQKQLRQIDKIAASGAKQQIVITQLAFQVRVMQKQLNNITKSVSRVKNIPNVKRKKNANSKRK